MRRRKCPQTTSRRLTMDTKKHEQKNPTTHNPNQKTNPTSTPKQEPYNPSKSNPTQKKPNSNW